jgi:dTDP-4-amino-4,6-dideoxygalactose transaminase
VSDDARLIATAGAVSPESGELPDIPVFDVKAEQADLDAVEEALRSCWWTMGERVDELEAAFTERLGSSHAVALSSCTTALHLALLCAGVGPGSEVILPSFTFVATAAAVLYCGAKPVFADVCGDHDLGIDPEEVERLIGPSTKAVIAVHYAGFPADVERLGEVCEREGIALIEDCAHAPAGGVGGKPLGTFGFAGTLSFFSNKVLAAGEGGLMVTDDPAAAERAGRLRNEGFLHTSAQRHAGTAPRYDVEEVGFNYRIDEMRAALVLSRLKRLDAEIAERRRLMNRYRERLQTIPGVQVPYRDEDVDNSACYTIAILVDAEKRDAARAQMTKAGVQTTLAYIGVHEFTYWREQFPDVTLPRTEQVSRRIFNLPLFPHLTDAQQDRVVESLEESLR